jgi:hypothetical protein
MLNTHDYRIAPGGDGPHAATWKDKPHRLIYDLCREVERLRGLHDGQRVIVNGVLPWGDWRGSSVETEGMIVEMRRTGALVSLDLVDGDAEVTTLVPKKLITPRYSDETASLAFRG